MLILWLQICGCLLNLERILLLFWGAVAAVCIEQGPAGDTSMHCSECLFFYVYPLLLLLLLSFFSPLFCFSFLLFLVFSYVFVFSWSVVLLAHLKRELDNMGLISFPISDLPKRTLAMRFKRCIKSTQRACSEETHVI